MLNKFQIEELRKAVDLIDLNKAIQDAKDMGIEVTKKELGNHGIYNEVGQLEIININKHFKIKDNIKGVDLNKNTNNETFSYSFKKENSKILPIEINKLLIV